MVENVTFNQSEYFFELKKERNDTNLDYKYFYV